MAKINSSQITFVDITDSRKLDIYISSNLPTTQIRNSNTGAYSPDWSTTNLQLTSDVYLDSKKTTPESIQWYTRIGTTETLVGSNSALTVSTNVLANNPIITYICKVTYQGIQAFKEITFMRTDTGLNGSNGVDGTGVTILGSYNTLAELQAAHPTGDAGDAYIVDGDLYVWATDGAQWENVGNIQGPAGADGRDAKSIVLSGDSQVFKVSKANAITPSTIKVTAQAFNTTVTNWTYSTNGGQTFLSTVPTGVSRNGNIVTVTGSTITSNSVVIKASDGEVEDVFTVYKAIDGADGDKGDDGAPAPIAFLTNENVTFSANAQGQISTTTITSNVVAYNGTTKVTPAIGTISGVPTGMTVTPSTITASNEVMLTITIANNSTLGSASNNMGVISIPITYPVSTVLSLTWSKVNTGTTGATGAAGSDAYTVMLTNESHIFAGEISNAVAGSTTTQVLAYKGAATQTVTISSVNGKTATTTDTDTGITGLKFKCSTLSGVSPTITFTCTTAFTSASGSIPIVLSVGGISFTKMFTYSIAFKGATGATGQSGSPGVPATAYWLVSSASAVQKTSTGTINVTPSTLTFTSKSQTGVGTPTDYACRWVIDYSTDGTTYTNLSTSTTNETSKSITVLTTYKTIRARMYLAGGTTVLLDEQIIPVVSDGAKGDKGNQGDRGVGISSVTVTYGTSTSASTQPTSWQTTIPTVAEGSYLWTRTITDYTDDSITDTVTYTYAKQGKTPVKGTDYVDGTSVTVSSIKYQASTSATTAPTGTWSDSVVTVAEGSYLWTKTTFSDGKIAYGVAKQGKSGSDAYTVILTNESHIFAGDVSNAIAGTAETQVAAYKGTTSQSVTITSVNGKTATTTDADTGITGLKFKCSALSGTSPTITFTCTTSFVSKSGSIPVVLSVGGVSFTKMFTYSIAFKGTMGNPGTPGSPGTPASLVDITPSAHYFKSTTGKDGTFTPDYIYLYPRFQTVTYSKWEYSTNGGTSWTTVTSGSNGLTIGTYNSIAYSLQIAKNSALYTDTVTSISFRCVSSNALVYDTVSIAKIYDVVDLQIGGRNYILNSANLYASGLDSVAGSRAEYRTIDVGQSYMNINSGTEVTISFDLEMTVNTANPTLTIYNGNRFGPKMITSKSIKFTAAVGDIIKQRCSVVTQITDRENPSLTTNTIEFYSTYDTSNWFKVSNLKLEVGNKATDWSPAPEDLKSTTFQLYAPKGYLITNDVPEVTLETFAYDGSQPITGATFVWSSWNGEAWTAISSATSTSLTLNKSNVLKSSVYKCDMTYGDKVYTATATVEDKTDVYDSLIHVTSKYSPTNRLYWVLYSTVYSEEGEKDELLGPVSVTAPTSPTTGAYWYKIDETNYTVTLMKYSGTAWAVSTDKQEFVYDWFMLNDTNNIVTLGERSKVKIVTADNFSRTCSVQCNVLDQELAALTHSNQVLNDPSDPIVSETEPSNPINGQLWIKTNASGSYMLLVWDASNSKWVVSEADTQKKVYVSKPTTYNDGDIWIVASEYEPDSYIDGVLQTEVVDGVAKAIKHLAGTMLIAQYGSETYKDSDWVSALNYKKEINKLKENLDAYNQFFTFDNTGMTMKAKNLNGQISEFSTKLTNNELGFYQGENKVAYINNNQLNISKAEITNGMVVGGDAPMIQIGNFVIMQESNGSLSIGLKS